MTIKKKIKLVQEKVEKDYNELLKPFYEREKEQLINDAYELAHYNEIAYFFENIEEDSIDWSETILDNIIDCKKNIVGEIWDSWRNYNHPERYNFFTWEDLSEIISWEFSRIR
jgi:hypothetical protein